MTNMTQMTAYHGEMTDMTPTTVYHGGHDGHDTNHCIYQGG